MLTLSAGAQNTLSNSTDLGRGDLSVTVHGQRTTSDTIKINGVDGTSIGTNSTPCVALVALNAAETDSNLSCSELARSPEMRETVGKIIDAANACVSSSERIKRFAILDRDFTPESDELTPTMKLKRDVVARNFQDTIHQLYENN